jgi:hypothetical protein
MSNRNKPGRKPATAAASKKNVKVETPNDTLTQEPIVGETPKEPQEEVKVETPNDTLTQEPIVGETPEEPIVGETPKDPVEEAQEIINDRKVKVFWHKACTNEKESTLTTLKKDEVLKKTDAKVSIPSEGGENIIKDVYSLKRGKRIYYLHDVTPQDCVRAEAESVKKAQEAAAEKAAKEALKESEKK